MGTAASSPISISCNPSTGPSSAGSTYTTSCTATGGRAPYTWTGIGVPFGLAVTNSNTSTVSVTGTLFGGSYNYSLQVTDSSTPVLTATYPFIGSLATATSSSITSMFPISTSGGSGAFTLTISGFGFVSGVTQVEFGSTLLPTTVNSSSQLTATVPASLVTSPGNVIVQLFGTASNTVDVFVTAGGNSAISTTTLSFTYGIGGTIPPAQTLSVSTLNGATGFSAVGQGSADGINWLVLNQASSVIPGSIAVSVSPAGLPLGTYIGTITLTGFSVGTSVVIPVTLTVLGQPAIVPTVTNLTLTSPAGGSASQTINVSSSDGVTVFPYKISALTNNGGNFLSVTPTTGTTPGSFTVTAASGTLVPSTYSGSITLTSTGTVGSQVSIPVTFIVTAPATLTLSPNSLSFTGLTGQSSPAAQNISVTASGNATVNYTVAATTTSGGNWLTATPTGTTPGNIAVNAAIGTLAAGTYNGAVTVTAPGTTNSPVTTLVSFTVTAGPSITSSPASLSFSYQVGGSTPAAQSISLSGPNNTSVVYTASATTASGGNWLTVSPTSGTTPSSVSVSINPANLAAGTYNGTITATGSGVGPLLLPVTLTVTSPTVTLTLTPTSLTFNATVAGSAPAAQTVAVSTTTSTAAPYTVTATTTSGGNWLTATATGTTPGTVSVTVNQAGLAVGQYTGSLSIASTGATNTPQTVQVTLNVTGAPMITAIPGNVTFLVPGDGSTPAPQSVTIISSGANTTFTASAVSQGGNWLTVTGGGTTPSSLMVSVNPAGLAAGQTYNGTISVTAPGSTPSNIQVPVTLTLAAQGTLPLVVTPSTVYLSYTQGAGTDLEHVAVLNNGGGSVSFSAQAQTANCGSWLTLVTPTGSATASSPSVLAFNVNPHRPVLPNLPRNHHCYRQQRERLQRPGVDGDQRPVASRSALPNRDELRGRERQRRGSAASDLPDPEPRVRVAAVEHYQSGLERRFVVIGRTQFRQVRRASSQVGSPINVSVSPTGLAPGMYYGTIQVTSSGTFNSPQSISVSFNVLPPPPPGGPISIPEQITPNGVIITIVSGTSDTQAVNVNNVSANTITFASRRSLPTTDKTG